MNEWRPLVTDLLRVAARVRAAPPLSALLRSGIVRRDARSEAAVALQTACAAPGLDLRATILRQFREEPSDRSEAVDRAFDALRRLNRLDAALARFRADGAFGAAPPRAPAGVRFVVGQPLYHRLHGRCVAYGWEPGPNAAVEPADAAALAREPLVDNRRYFVGIDDASPEQPFYRVLRADGVALLCAQEMLEAVPDPRGLERPVRGSSYFFTGADPAGFLVPNADLAARFPEDVRLLGDPAARVDLLGIDSTAKYAQLWLNSWRKLGRRPTS